MEGKPAAGLSAEAAEFVPGLPVAAGASAPQPSGPPAAVPAQTAHQLRDARAAAVNQAPAKSAAPDLPTRIQEDIDNGVYECVICTSEVVRTSRIWTCSVCWTVTHLHCAKKWHANQAKNLQEGQVHLPGWRCPGCNSSLADDPTASTCWCGKEVNLRPVVGLPAHSCGQTCGKSRPTCPHPCTLLCHAGPCPPCQLMGETQTCFCGKNTVTKRCSETEYGRGWSCQEVCGDFLSCGEHECPRPCHSGLCGSCEVLVTANCYCGKESKDMICDQRGEILSSFNYGQLEGSSRQEEPIDSTDPWFEGCFDCGQECGRLYDCGHHACQQTCHAQEESPGHCPYSPDVVSFCPCGKTPLEELMSGERTSCQDEVPRCSKLCEKPLGCGHTCPDSCHVGACKPCKQEVEIPCRCGRTTTPTPCIDRDTVHPTCSRVCHTQLNCGRHECGQVCCPGEKKAAQRQAARRKHKLGTAEDLTMEEEHRCLQICGRELKCGQHHCEQLCHKGPCPSCLEAIFDDIVCACGRTRLLPPLACGTRPPECRFDCVKPTACGHPAVRHNCHTEETACPKCPFLVEKTCLCGKKTLKNQPCWFEEPRCGIPCGKKLKCGAHSCEKTCHRPGECEDAETTGSHCSQPCRKTKRSCEHFCADQCHAPYACKEDKPCQGKTLVTCECQNRKQEVKCLASKTNPWPTREPLKCDDECLRLQRNRRLAEALNIDPDTHMDSHIPYSDETLKMYKDNVAWAQTQEREFRVFASAADEKRLRFKPMQPQQRAFLHSLAEDFGLDSESQDPEGIRHVTLFKTPRFVSAPTKTLARCLIILRATMAAAAKPTTPAVPGPTYGQSQRTYNAFLLNSPRFGLTIDEVDAALAKPLSVPKASSLVFTTNFLPSEQVLIAASPKTTAAAALAASRPLTPEAIELALRSLKSTVAETIAREGLADSVILCRAEGDLDVVRREGDSSDGADGAAGGGGGGQWSTVAKRSANRPARATPSAAAERAPSSFVALKKESKLKLKLKGKTGTAEEPLEEDWLAAAEREEKDSDTGDALLSGSGADAGPGAAWDTLVEFTAAPAATQ